MTWVPYKCQRDRTEFKFLRSRTAARRKSRRGPREKICVMTNLPIFQQGCCKSRTTSGLWEEGQHQGSGRFRSGAALTEVSSARDLCPSCQLFQQGQAREETRIHLALIARPCPSSSLARELTRTARDLALSTRARRPAHPGRPIWPPAMFTADRQDASRRRGGGWAWLV